MPAAVRPKGKARKIKESIMGPMPNEPRTRVSKKKGSKSKYIADRLAFEEASRVK